MHEPTPGRALRAPRASAARLVLAAAAALSLAGVTLWGGGIAAHAAAGEASIDPDAVTAIEIHKLRQPDELLPPASGLPLDTGGMTPVAGAAFTATRVPGIDPTTPGGQSAISALTAEEAEVLVGDAPAAARATTDAGGDATLGGLAVGVYLVREVATPAGFAPSVPFVVALPLTDPRSLDRWLYTVHVYPKNAFAGVELGVTDHDAVTLGDPVSWLSLSGIPHVAAVDGYRLVQRLDPLLTLLTGAPDDASVTIRCDASRATCAQPVEGVDFTRSYDPGANQLTIDFTSTGLALLSRTVAADPAAQVALAYRTTATADGELYSESVMYASRAAIAGGTGAPAPVSDRAVTKWGPLAIVVHERGVPDHLIAGAVFRLYRSADDAAHGVNAIIAGGRSEWTTDAQGRIDIPGLRLSGFVDGLDRAVSDPLFRSYYAVPVSFPAGYTGSTAALRTVVDSTSDPQVVVVELWRVSTAGGLPVTGGQIPWTIGIAAFALIGVGLVIVLRRRSRPDAPEGS